MSFKSALLAAFMMSSVGAFATGCGNACDDAADKLKNDCGFPGDGVVVDECSDKAECSADCVNDASCSEIKAAFAGEQNSYASCTAKCL
jgi:hypothetical protein